MSANLAKESESENIVASPRIRNPCPSPRLAVQILSARQYGTDPDLNSAYLLLCNRQHQADKMQLKHSLAGKIRHVFPGSGGGEGGKGRSMAWFRQQRAQLTHVSIKEPSLGAVRAPEIFVINFTFSKGISKLQGTKLCCSHSVLSSWSSTIIFYCPQVQPLKLPLLHPGSSMGKRMKIKLPQKKRLCRKGDLYSQAAFICIYSALALIKEF